MGSHRITFEIDLTAMFDVIAQVGDGGEALGQRLVATLLGDTGVTTSLGLAVYGVILKERAAISRAKGEA